MNLEARVRQDHPRASLAAVLAQPRVKKLLSTEHFSVDGTLIEAWASMKSFRPKDGSDELPGGGRNSEADFHRQADACGSCGGLRRLPALDLTNNQTLDHAASDGHSYGCSSGPPRNR